MVAVTSMPMGQPMGQPQMNATSPMPNPMGGSAPNPMMPTNPMPNDGCAYGWTSTSDGWTTTSQFCT